MGVGASVSLKLLFLSLSPTWGLFFVLFYLFVLEWSKWAWAQLGEELN